MKRSRAIFRGTSGSNVCPSEQMNGSINVKSMLWGAESGSRIFLEWLALSSNMNKGGILERRVHYSTYHILNIILCRWDLIHLMEPRANS